MSDHLFAYGTLRRGRPLSPHLQSDSARFLGEGEIDGRLFDLGDYPAAIRDTKRFSKVRGELYELLEAERTLSLLDEIEGFDPKRPERSVFVRRRATVRLESGRSVEAWVYFYARSPIAAPEIADGDYIRYLAEQ